MTLGHRVRRVLDAEGGVELLGAQVESVSAYHQGNYLPLLWQFHADHRSVLFRVLELIGLAPTTQDTALIDAWCDVLQHRRARRATVPNDIDLGFLSQRWIAFVQTQDEHGNPALDRRALEVCVFTHIAEALQAGDLCVPGSAAYADYRTQLLPWEECTARLHTYCDEVEIPRVRQRPGCRSSPSAQRVGRARSTRDFRPTASSASMPTARRT